MTSPARPLRLPEDIRYSCIRCGRSCEDWTEVEIDADEAERVRRLPLFDPKLAPRDPDELPYVAGTREPGQLLLRFDVGDDGATSCVFRNDDHLCAIHAAHGELAKPATCRAFPFWFVDTPDAELSCVSFACTAVLHDLGAPLRDQYDAVHATARFATHRERRGRHLLLAPGTPLPWRDYGRLEQRLVDGFDRHDDIGDALFAQAAIICRDAGFPPPSTAPSSRLTDAIVELLLDIAGRPPRFHPPITDLAPPEPTTLMRRWLRHRLWRKDLTRGGEVMFAHTLLVAEAAVASRWAAMQPAGLSEAIAEVERGLSLHSDLVQRLEADHGLLDRARRLLHAPRAPASLVAAIRSTLVRAPID